MESVSCFASLMMISSRLLFFFCIILINLFVLSTSQQPEVHFLLCVNKDNGTYTANSPYQKNLNNLLTSIYNNTEINYGFYNFSYGQNPDQVYAIALCRGDIKPEACRSCINYSGVNLTSNCTNQKEAYIGLDNCTLRYSDRIIFNHMEDAPYYWVYNVNNVSNVNQFNQSRQTLLDKLRDEAAAGDSLKKYAYGQMETPNFQTIYAIAQCTPDITQAACSYCIDNATARIPDCCEAKQGGRIIYPSCNFWYEINQFYDIPLVSSPSPSPSPPSNSTVFVGKESSTSRTVTIIVVPVVIFVILIICISIFISLRVRKPIKKYEQIEDISSVESLQLDFETVKVATDDFSDANKLGQGGFGAVYKGRLPDGQEIAVKRLSRNSGQGDLEFKNEVLLVAKLQHRNLVRLLGFCLEGIERLLIYEFVPNSSLDNFIFDPVRRLLLDWEVRCKIIGGIARGILYLHEDSRLRIIHRDLKASNILLDAGMNPKISDFGMARLFALDQTQGDTNRIVGTFGYMAPEYVTRGHFSVKSDVFSFGVLVLEIMSGQKISSFRNGEDEEDLLTFAWQSWQEGRALNFIDPALGVNSRNEMLRCIHIGLLCVQENVADRPTMASVVLMLTSDTVSLPIPLKPAFFMHSTVHPETSPREYNSGLTTSDQSNTESAQYSINEASITELDP